MITFNDKTLVAFGCSWMEGYYEGEFGRDSGRSPGLKVSNILKFNSFINLATNGSSNDKIVRRAVEFISAIPKQELKNYFFLVGWTNLSRSELTINLTRAEFENAVELLPDGRQTDERLDFLDDNPPAIILQTTLADYKVEDPIINYSVNRFLEVFWKNSSDIYLLKKKILNILFLQSLFNDLGVNYYFYNASSFLCTAFNEKEISTVKLIDTKNYFFPFEEGKTQFNYLKNKGYKEGWCNHWDHDATDDWAMVISNAIKEVYL